VGDLTSDLGGIITTATSDLGGITTDLPITDPPITTDPITTDPITTDPITTDPITTDPITTDPITTDPITTDPITTDPSTITTTDPLDGVFPGGTGSLNITTTISDPVKPTTLSIDSDYQFISASTFLGAPTTTTDIDVTNTDPDAVQTSGADAGTGTTLTAAIIPTSIPMFITPPASSDPTPPGTTIDGFIEISILFKPSAGWMWVLTSTETAAQILAYMGPIIKTSLNINGEDVKTVGLQAFVPNDYTRESDLGTLWLGQIPIDQVSVLSVSSFQIRISMNQMILTFDFLFIYIGIDPRPKFQVLQIW
jgi:hypothetical protein